MIGHRDFNLDDYLRILRRRRWWIIIPAVIVPVVATAVSFTLPERYKSTTLVLVEQQKVPEDFVKSVVSDELNERLGTMREQILSRTRLQPIIERFGLYKADVGKVPMEDLVARLREAIDVTPIKPLTTSRRQGEVPGFFISFTASEARTAQQVCSEITSLFMQENLKSRQERAQGTTEFLQKQVEEAKAKLDEHDKKLAAFKQRYIGQLPGQEDTNMKLLLGFNTQMEAVTQALNRAQQDKTYLESLLGQQLSTWKASRAGANPDSLERQLVQQEGELVALEAKYTSDHPDVIKARANVAQLRSKIEETKRAPRDTSATDTERGAEPVEIRQLRGQIHQLTSFIKEKTREQERIQGDIRIYQARVQLSPVVEQQFKELNRDYETALKFHNDLLAKKTESEIATDLERRQQGEQFRMVDPANLPEKPTFPNRPMFAGGGLAGGLALGLALALLLEMKDKSIRDERDVEVLLGIPTLAQIPIVGMAASKGKMWPARGKSELETGLAG